ncbi:MAG: VOC family protein [Acidimicrobiales bacterium]|jgi:catechol 2,3-dioxygenase-like lactoylglutathione lyase family enzyme|nr:VOC family protein [Acidimicrobiales bacterium]
MALSLPRPYHVNVNCSDLDRSLAFYEGLLGFTTLARTTPSEPQPGAAFGLEQVQWDAWILAGASGMAGLVLDLLEWKVPTPAGRPATRTEQGFAALGIAVPDLASTVASLEGAGHRVDGSTVTDPDGTILELVEGNGPAIAHLAVNVADLTEARGWYERVLGLTGTVEERSGGGTSVACCTLPVPGAPFSIELRQWTSPAPVTRAPRRANELGIFRHALFSLDIHADHGRLTELGVACYTPPVALDMGPGMPSDLLALFFDDPSGACLELIQPPAG